MNQRKSKPESKLEVGLIVRLTLFAILVCVAGVGFVFIKNQQHALGNKTREVERQLRELESSHKVLVTEITSLTSHSRLSQAVAEGLVSLVGISDQYVARLNQPTVVSGTGEFRAASAVLPGELRP